MSARKNFSGELIGWPPPQRYRWQIRRMFGNPGTDAPDGSWEARSLVEVRDLPGVPCKWYVSVNKQVEPAMREGLRRAFDASDYQIERFACHVWRKIRHSRKKNAKLSLHAYGIAFDVDPARNSPRHYTKNPPEPWSPRWLETWPRGVDEKFVLALESIGWSWGGRWRRFVDPMHFEWRRR